MIKNSARVFSNNNSLSFGDVGDVTKVHYTEEFD
jgi:hypothetical protein